MGNSGNAHRKLRSAESKHAKTQKMFDHMKWSLRGYREELNGESYLCFEPEVRLPGRTVTRAQLCGCSDYKYVYLTILGFESMYYNADKIMELNNGELFQLNPGTQMLERKCGITMHGDRPGANSVVKNAPRTMIEAYKLALASDNTLRFFVEAFDRTADPCLEGRIGRLLAFVETFSSNELCDADRPWEDFALQPLTGVRPEFVVGEYLRVFTNECIYSWSHKQNLTYARAKNILTERGGEAEKYDLADLDRLCNHTTFVEHLRVEKVFPDIMTEEEAVSISDIFVELDTLTPKPDEESTPLTTPSPTFEDSIPKTRSKGRKKKVSKQKLSEMQDA